jgi:hypothetical protein
MAKITWTPRTNSGADSAISASIFNEISSSVNDLYDSIEAQFGGTESLDNVFGYTGSAGDAGTLTVSASIIPLVSPGSTTSSAFDLGSETAAWRDIYVSTGSLKFVGPGGITASLSLQDVEALKEGKSISTASAKQVVNIADPDTYIKNSVADRMTFFSNGTQLIDLTGASKKVKLGGTSAGVDLQGVFVNITGSTTNTGSFENTGSLNITGSLSNTGSFDTTGSFAVNDLLTLLANFGAAGLATGSAATGSDNGVAVGDINLDGQVNVNDLLLVLGGFGNPNTITSDTTIPANVNHQLVGPTITISEGVTFKIVTGSFVLITS